MNFVVIGNSSTSATYDIAEEGEIGKALQKVGHNVWFIDRDNWREIEAITEQIDYVFAPRYLKIEASDIKKIKNILKCPYILWQPDHCDIENPKCPFRDMAKECDIWLGRDLEGIDWFKENGVEYYYWNFDVACDIFKKEYDERVAMTHPQTSFPIPTPVNFIGNWVHNPFRMNFLYELQQKISDDLHITTLTIREYATGQMSGKTTGRKLKNLHNPIFGEGFNKLVGITKINLSLDWIISEGYWSPRTARIMCAGGFALVHYVKGMEKTFKDYVVYYNSVEDCVEKIKFYLEHDDEREVIANRGYEYANKYLRPKNRVKELLIYLQNR